MIASGAQDSLANFPSQRRKDSAKQPRWYSAHSMGPTETKEHMGGFWILEAANMDEALRVGAQGCHHMRCGGRCANFYSSRLRMKQRNSLAAARWRWVVVSGACREAP
jgi:hypothetical protein